MREKLDLEALHYYLSYKHVPSPLTIWKGKYKQPLIDLSHLKWVPAHKLTEEKVVDRLDQLLRLAVEKKLATISKPFGFFISGGIDSGIVLAIASKLTSKPLRTFSLVYTSEDETEGKRRDREYARWISEIYRTKHVEFVINFEGIWKELPRIIKVIGEPFSGYVSIWFISKLAKRKGISQAFSGDWPDELFGSYKAHRLAYEHPDESLLMLRYQTLVFMDEEKAGFYSNWMREKTKNYSTLEHLKGYFESLSAEDSLNRMLESEFRSWFPDHTYMSIRKLSKACQLEILAPWGDPNVVDFAIKIPGELKMKGGETKHVEKKLAERYLPEEIVYREKEGFVAPTSRLVLKLESHIRDALSPENLKEHGLFDIENVQKLLNKFYKKPEDGLAYKIWNLASFQVWHEVFHK